MKPTVGIVALGAANRRSIAAALQRAGAQTHSVTEPGAVFACDALVIPGVAHFGYVAAELDRTGLRTALLESWAAGLPLLGICVGFQLLFETSDEAPGARGLGIFSGNVRLLRTPRVPHMGWNRVEPCACCAAIEPGYGYFANSYAPDADAPDAIASSSDGNDCFASAGLRGCALGVQFHPERSGAYGARLLRTFVDSAAVAYAR
ncbi:MAG TPA: imidazole glycerol phosphate synthase subunit HisH [Candidatus Baltobacteraceae bacterium]|nr:imidazole glycerol phosphate synthase subunit HisH [Candidatus Baltobacteraceae bacterium]